MCSVKRKPRTDSTRTVRRKLERAGERLIADRERLFELEPGGNPSSAIEVTSASVVDLHAERSECPRCAGKLLAVEQAAVTVGGVRLREARLRCRDCGARRSRWFRIVGANPN
jgi:hypothetical protein